MQYNSLVANYNNSSQMSNRPQIINPTPQTNNTDLKLIRSFLQKPFEPNLEPRSMAELSTILKNRIVKKNVSRDQKTRTRQWLATKGIDVQPLLELVTKNKKDDYEGKERNKLKEQNKIITKGESPFEIEIYLSKAVMNAHSNLRQFAFTSRNRNKWKEIALSSLQKREYGFVTSLSDYQIDYRQGSFRNEQNRQRCIKLLIELMQRQKQKLQYQQQTSKVYPQKINWISQFSDISSHSIWKILLKQTQKIDMSQSTDLITMKLLLNSLKIVQQQLNQLLPNDQDSINRYLQQYYLSHFDQQGEYILDLQHGSFWGKIFLLYRAKRISEVVALLKKYKQNNLAQIIMDSQQKIRIQKPEKYYMQNNSDDRDVFREQLYFALGGQRKYSSDVLSNPMELDCVWILLRNTGIFYRTDYECFKQIRDQMINYYKNNQISNQTIKFIAYLLDYDCIVQLGVNSCFEIDDFLHFLIVMSRYPKLIVNHQFLKLKLTEMTICYAIELLKQGKPEYIYYLLQIPQQKFIQQASAIIVSNDIFLTTDWAIFKKYLNQDIFVSFIKATTQKYVQNTDNYHFGAQKLVKFIDNKEMAIELLIRLFIKHFTLGKKYERDIVNQALKNFQKWLNQNEGLQRNYSKLLQLFVNEERLSHLLLNRRYDEIQTFLVNTNLVFLNNVDFQYSKMFQKLLQFKGIEVYFIYIRSLLKAADMIFTKKNKDQELRNYRYQILKTCKTILSNDKLQAISRQQSVIRLVEDLNNSLLSNDQSFMRSY